MPEVRVKNREGAEYRIDAAAGAPLMEALRENRFGVDGTCGGACSCGTCHVYVAEEWIARLPDVGGDEAMMLDALAEFVPVRPTSRLSCQIPVSDATAGLGVEIAPAVD